MTCAVAIFVKTPGFSALKTRLAGVTGTAFAEQLHGHAARATASVIELAVAGGDATGYWAVAEQAAHGHWTGFHTVAQGPGTLGERMGRVHTELVARHGQAILIGADSPQIRAADIIDAIARLQNPDPALVLGPARDGGFWLVGANRHLPMADWTGVEYSREDTCERFVRAMARHGPVARLRAIRDVDEADDLAPLSAALQRLAAPTSGQTRLREWLDKRLRAASGDWGLATGNRIA